MRVDTALPLASSELLADPYPFFAEERCRAPIQWHDGLQMWLAFSHQAANAVLRARTLGRIWHPRFPDNPGSAFELIHVNSLLENEPPVHTRLRRLVAGAFSRGHVERLQPRVAALAAELADRVEEQGADGDVLDLVSCYAEPLPVWVIAELLGVPRTDWGLLRPWSNAIVRMYEYGVSDSQRNDAERAAAEFVAYLRAMVAERRHALTDDLVSSLISEVDSDGARLSEDELITTCTLLLNAGHEATVNVVSNGVLAMGRNPDQWQRLVQEADLIETAVEELIRYDSPLQLFERTAVAETTIADVTIPQGGKIAALLGSANRDPEVFAEPDRLDLGRADNPHLGFGAGIHFCVGAPLARLELRTSLRTLSDRFPALALAGEPPPRTEFVIRGVRRLPITIR